MESKINEADLTLKNLNENLKNNIQKKNKCIRCNEYKIRNLTHDLCRSCWKKQKKSEKDIVIKTVFENNLETYKIHTVYIMFYGIDKNKIGYTNDLNSRIIENKREYPNNKLVYFREFTKETEAREFEAWLKTLTNRELNKFISTFQDKLRKIEVI